MTRIAYQFDQCCSDPDLIDRCNNEGLAQALPLPLRCHGLLDPDLLRELLPLGNPIVTTDWALPEEHCPYIPDSHPGIIAIRYSIYVEPRLNRTMTTRGAASILANFKGRYPNWHLTSISNCILYISEADVELAAIQAGRHRHVCFAAYVQVGWQLRLAAAITNLAWPRPLVLQP
jgi:hypothetical protein